MRQGAAVTIICAIGVEAESGHVLFEDQAARVSPPASMASEGFRRRARRIAAGSGRFLAFTTWQRSKTLAGAALARALKAMPVVVVTGARQTGKTTLANRLTPGRRSMISGC